jgi:Leucine-rich repeat (LRR) protein
MNHDLSLTFPAKPSLGNLYVCRREFPHNRSWRGQAAGTVELSVPEDHLAGLAFASTSQAKQLIEHKEAIAKLASADLSTTTVSASLLQALFEITQLVEIRLDFLPLSGEVLTEFAGGHGLEHLVTLWLTGTSVTDGDLNAFQNLKAIQHLALKSTPITNGALATLAKFANLTHLHLPRQINDHGLEALSSSKSLLELDLSYSSITDDGLAFIKSMPQLETLYINDTAISDTGLTHLSDHPGLKVLFLNGTKITDKGLENLAALENLNHLELRDTTATEIGAARLKAKLRDCAIFGP